MSLTQTIFKFSHDSENVYNSCHEILCLGQHSWRHLLNFLDLRWRYPKFSQIFTSDVFGVVTVAYRQFSRATLNFLLAALQIFQNCHWQHTKLSLVTLQMLQKRHPRPNFSMRHPQIFNFLPSTPKFPLATLHIHKTVNDDIPFGKTKDVTGDTYRLIFWHWPAVTQIIQDPTVFKTPFFFPWRQTRTYT